MKRLALVAVVALSVCSVCACASKPLEGKIDEPTKSAEEMEEFKEAVAAGGGLSVGNIEMYKQYLSEGENFLYSPYSLRGCLSIIYPGISGESKTQFADVLGFDEDTVSAFETYENMLKEEDFGVKTANRVYINNDFKVNKKNLRETEAKIMSFSSNGAVKKVIKDVNKFAADSTEDKITDLLTEDDVTSNTALIAVNAIYFKKGWAFADSGLLDDKAKITWHPLSSTGEIAAKYKAVGIDEEYLGSHWGEMIKTDDEFGVDITRLPYDRTREDEPQFSMYIITDLEESLNNNVKAFINSLDDEQLNEWLDFDGYSNPIYYDEIHIKFPKFEFDDRSYLIDALSNCGIRNIFESSSGDLDDIAKNLYVSNIVQSTYIKVDEKGTEAAAATSTTIQNMANFSIGDEEKEPPKIKYVYADNPFAYIIRDDTNGVILFMGYVERLDDIGDKTL